MYYTMDNPLPQILAASGITQEELAKRLEVSASSVSQTLRSKPRLSTVVRYATAAGVRTLTIDLTRDPLDMLSMKMMLAGHIARGGAK